MVAARSKSVRAMQTALQAWPKDLLPAFSAVREPIFVSDTLRHRHALHTSAPLQRRDDLGDPSSFFIPRSTPANTIIRIVPQQMAFVIESLKETTIPVPNQTAITKDNVSLTIDGVLYVKVMDPYAASYGVENAMFAVTQLAQTTMRSELGKISLDAVFAERDQLNQGIVASIQPAASAWGLEVLRYEIRDILPPPAVRTAMELQAEAERRKRASILESEGQRQSKINVAEARKSEVILASEASKEDQINRAVGEAEAIYRRADATARGIQLLADSIAQKGGSNAVSLRVAEQYLDAFKEIAKKGTTMLLPASGHDPASMVAQALSIYGAVSSQGRKGDDGSDGEGPSSDRGNRVIGNPNESVPQPTTPKLDPRGASSRGGGGGERAAQRPPVFTLQKQ